MAGIDPIPVTHLPRDYYAGAVWRRVAGEVENMPKLKREDIEANVTMVADVVQAYIDRHMCVDPRCTGNARTCPAYAEWLENTMAQRTMPKLTRRERLQYYWDRLRYTMAEKIYPEVFDSLDDYE